MGDAPPSLPDPSLLKSKGFTLKGALAFVEARHGPEGVERVVAALDPSAREVVGGVILSSNWYPFALQVGLYEAIDRAFGRGDLALCRHIGRFTAEHELSTVHRATLRLTTLSLWLRMAGPMWRQYYSAGSVTAKDFREGACTVVVEDFNPIARAFCQDFSGWLERIAELNGKRAVTVTHPECVLEAHRACRYEATWSA
jgi:hypothetical protein